MTNLEKLSQTTSNHVNIAFVSQMTSRYIAVKQCRQQDELSERTKNRWALECEIMLQLDHPNIVKGLPLPEELSQISNGSLPVLAMEFCKMGDLRKVDYILNVASESTYLAYL